MKKIFYLAILSISLFSCAQGEDKNNQETADLSDALIDAPSSTDTSCYVYKQDGTDINFRFYSSGDDIKGKLYYAIAEKDKNDGDFEGRFMGDTLLGIYTFNSEGKRSVRQIAFVKKDNTLIEGIGSIQEFGDTVRFKNVHDLQYISSTLLQKVNCDK